jgi:hypothetical protein
MTTTQTIPVSGTVHWLGAGLSSGSGLAIVANAARRTHVWARTPERARRLVDGLRPSLESTADVDIAAWDAARLGAAVQPGDLVVSMVPADEHPAIAALCLRAGAHFACSSYTSPLLAQAGEKAAAEGLVMLTEAGLDPGLDHLLAHVLVDEARDAVGTGPATARFLSVCGGVPAVPNDFRYKFSWAPRGVLHALRSPARFLARGQLLTAAEPWEHVRSLRLPGGESVEVYPNRDSLAFVGQYGFPVDWTVTDFQRGTVRLEGWQAAWQPVFAVLRGDDDARIDAYADELARRYPTGPADHDRVILWVSLGVAGAGTFSGGLLLDMEGDDRATAMSRCVSLPLAVGVEEILSGRLPAGLSRCAEDPTAARRWLDRLRQLGLVLSHTG